MLDLKIVRKGADYRWLRKQTKDEATLQLLNEFEKLDPSNGEIYHLTDTSLVSFQLQNQTVWLRRSDAAYSLQIYTELFKENDHFLVEEILCNEKGTVLDLGANVGFYTLKVKQMYPECRVIAVEPDPTLFEILKKNVEDNGLKNVKLVNKAISGTDKNMIFRTSIYAGVLGSKYMHTLKRDMRLWLKDEMITKIKVSGVRIPSLMQEYKLKRIDLVKLDIEDMEYEVLKASESILENIRTIVMQWHNPITRDQVINLLNKHGFGIIYNEPRDYGDIYFENSLFTHL